MPLETALIFIFSIEFIMTDTDIYAAYIAGNCPAPRLLTYLDLPHTPLLLRATEQAMACEFQGNLKSQRTRDSWWEALPPAKKATHPRTMMEEWQESSLASKECVREIIRDYITDFAPLPDFDEELVLGTLLFGQSLCTVEPAAILDDLRYAAFIAMCRDNHRHMTDVSNRHLAVLMNPMAPHTRFMILFNTMRHVEIMKAGVVFDMLHAFNASAGDYTRVARQLAAIREHVSDGTKIERAIRRDIAETEKKFNLGRSRLIVIDKKSPAP